MVQIVWSETAKNDLKAIYNYISVDSEKYARKQVQRIYEKIKVLKSSKISGKMVLESNDETIREIIEGNYRIIFQIESNHSINILTIHHGARDLLRRKIL